MQGTIEMVKAGNVILIGRVGCFINQW